MQQTARNFCRAARPYYESRNTLSHGLSGSRPNVACHLMHPRPTFPTQATIDHPNRVKDIAMRRMGEHKELIDQAVARLLETNDTIDDIIDELYTKMKAVIAGSGDFETVRRIYWKYLGFRPPASPPPPSALAPADKGRKRGAVQSGVDGKPCSFVLLNQNWCWCCSSGSFTCCQPPDA